MCHPDICFYSCVYLTIHSLKLLSIIHPSIFSCISQEIVFGGSQTMCLIVLLIQQHFQHLPSSPSSPQDSMCFGLKSEQMWALESNILSSYPVCEIFRRLWSDSICSLALKKMETGTKGNTCHTFPTVSHTWQVSILLTQNSTFSDLFTFKKAKYTKKEVQHFKISRSSEHQQYSSQGVWPFFYLLKQTAQG